MEKDGVEVVGDVIVSLEAKSVSVRRLKVETSEFRTLEEFGLDLFEEYG
jgi:hypothetical protein